MCVRYPEEYGGAGVDKITEVVLREEMSRICQGIATSWSGHSHLATYPIFKAGTPGQIDAYLLPAIRGAKIGAFALSEPDAGSDVKSITATAEKTPDGYILRGAKTFITNAPIADFFMTAAYTDKSQGYRGISLFIVDAATPGLQVRKLDKEGIRSSDTGEIFFDDCPLPQSALLGGREGTFGLIMKTLSEGRVGVAANMVGVAQAAFEASLRYAKERTQFGQAIGKFQAVSHQLADMAAGIRAAPADGLFGRPAHRPAQELHPGGQLLQAGGLGDCRARGPVRHPDPRRLRHHERISRVPLSAGRPGLHHWRGHLGDTAQYHRQTVGPIGPGKGMAAMHGANRMSLGYLAAKNALYTPHKDFLIEGERRINFQAFHQQSDALASGLLARGLEPGGRVAVINHNSVELLLAYFGAMKAGGVAAPVSARLSPPEITAILQDAEPSFVLVGRDYLDKLEPPVLQALPGRVYVIGGGGGLPSLDELTAAGGAPPEPGGGMDGLAMLIYTSGTTGRPKGVMLSHGNLWSDSFATALSRGLSPDDIALVSAPLYQAGALGSVLGNVLRGNSIVLLDGFDPEKVLQAIQRERVTTALLVPTMLLRLLEHPALESYDLGSVKSIVYGAAPMPVPVLKRALDRFGWSFAGACGATETGPAYIAFLGPEDHKFGGGLQRGEALALHRQGGGSTPRCASSIPRTGRCRRARWARSWCADRTS